MAKPPIERPAIDAPAAPEQRARDGCQRAQKLAPAQPRRFVNGRYEHGDGQSALSVQ